MKTPLSYRTFTRLLIAGLMLLAALGTASSVAAQSSCGATYTVQPGDYLSKIARICGVSYHDLLDANPGITDPSRIYPGEVLNIPTGGIPVTGSQPGAYTVQYGDTLSSIAHQFGITMTELREANPSLHVDFVTGQVLFIPSRIRFAEGGTSAIVQDHLGPNSRHVYLLAASSGQTLEATASATADLTLAIAGADDSTLKSASDNLSFRGVLPLTQDYVLTLTSGDSPVDYSLSVDVPERIRFASGGTSATLTGTVPAGLSQYFILRAAKGQTLNVTATPQDKLQLIIYGVDGDVLRSGMGEGASFSGTLPSTQDYILALKTAGVARAFTLKVSIPASSPAPTSGSNSYTVQKGDTLFSIARRFNTTVTILLRANPQISNANVISVGQVIYLPGAVLTLSNGQVVYITMSGDTLGEIARLFEVSLDDLLDENPQISNPNLIYPGQRIFIP